MKKIKQCDIKENTLIRMLSTQVTGNLTGRS
jgi:hypothetical protein